MEAVCGANKRTEVQKYCIVESGTRKPKQPCIITFGIPSLTPLPGLGHTTIPSSVGLPPPPVCGGDLRRPAGMKCFSLRLVIHEGIELGIVIEILEFLGNGFIVILYCSGSCCCFCCVQPTCRNLGRIYLAHTTDTACYTLSIGGGACCGIPSVAEVPTSGWIGERVQAK